MFLKNSHLKKTSFMHRSSFVFLLISILLCVLEPMNFMFLLFLTAHPDEELLTKTLSCYVFEIVCSRISSYGWKISILKTVSLCVGKHKWSFVSDWNLTSTRFVSFGDFLSGRGVPFLLSHLNLPITLLSNGEKKKNVICVYFYVVTVNLYLPFVRNDINFELLCWKGFLCFPI